MKMTLQYIFTIFWIIAIAGGLYETKDWNSTTALFPRVVGFPMLILMVSILIMDIKKGLALKKEVNTNIDIEFKSMIGRMLKYFCWLLGLIILIWAVGIVYAIPVYILGYMKIEGKYSYLKSSVSAAASTVFIVFLYNFILQVAWPKGFLFGI